MEILKKIIIITGLLCPIIMFNVHAQVSQNSKFSVSSSAELGLPIGHLSKHYDWSLGGSVEVEYSVNDRFRLTYNMGYFNLFANKNEIAFNNNLYNRDLHLMPIQFGLKYFVVKAFFMQCEGGASFLLNKSDGGPDKSSVFNYSSQIGYRINLRNEHFMYIALKWTGNSKYTDQGASNHILGLKVAYGLGVY